VGVVEEVVMELILNGATVEKVFQNYGPGWDKCDECGQTMEAPASRQHLILEHALVNYTLNAWRLKPGTVLKHRSKVMQERHNRVVSARAKAEEDLQYVMKKQWQQWVAEVHRCIDCGTPCSPDEPLCWNCECGD
jgi:hypothetical protein